MLLRRANDRYEQELMGFESHEDGSVHVFFRNFGKGAVNTSDFIAIFDWGDVEALAKVFAAKGNPGAVRFQQAKNLAAAIEYFSKNSN